MARNRAQRRATGATGGRRPAFVVRDEVRRMTLPGLPGGPPYTTMAEKRAVLLELQEAVGAMTPDMAYHADRVSRDLPGLPPKRLREKREVAPGGLGSGVLIGADGVVESTSLPDRSPALFIPRSFADAERELQRGIDHWKRQP